MDIGYRLQCCHLRSKSKIYMQYACNMFAICLQHISNVFVIYSTSAAAWWSRLGRDWEDAGRGNGWGERLCQHHCCPHRHHLCRYHHFLVVIGGVIIIIFCCRRLHHLNHGQGAGTADDGDHGAWGADRRDENRHQAASIIIVIIITIIRRQEEVIEARLKSSAQSKEVGNHLELVLKCF